MVIFIIIILLYHPELVPVNRRFICKLSSDYTWPILNDKLSISNHVLTMCLSPLHRIVILSCSLEKIFRVIFSAAFSDAPVPVKD